jgi:WD40 repeat protein
MKDTWSSPGASVRLVFAGLLPLCLVLWTTPARPADPPDIDRLIKQLGSPTASEREAAVKQLEQIGEPALPALRKVAGDTALDADVRLRALVVVNGVVKDSMVETNRLTGNQSFVQCIAWSPDGKYVASGHDNGLLVIWNTSTGQMYRQYRGHLNRVMAAAWTPDSKQVLTGGEDKTMRLWDLARGTEVRRFEGHTDWLFNVAVSSDGKRALSCSGLWAGTWQPGTDRTARLWDLATAKEVRQFKGHTSWIHFCVFAPDGRHVLTGGGDHTVRLWDADTGKEVRRFQGHTSDVWAGGFSRDGQRAVTVSNDKTVRVWQVATGKQLLVMRAEIPGADGFNSGAVYAGGDRVLAGSRPDNTIRMWDARKAKEVFSVQLADCYPTSIAVSADGKRAATGDSSGSVRLWRLGN